LPSAYGRQGAYWRHRHCTRALDRDAAACILARLSTTSCNKTHDSGVYCHLLQVHVKQDPPCCRWLATYLGIFVSRPGALCTLAPQRAPLSRRAVQVAPQAADKQGCVSSLYRHTLSQCASRSVRRLLPTAMAGAFIPRTGSACIAQVPLRVCEYPSVAQMDRGTSGIVCHPPIGYLSASPHSLQGGAGSTLPAMARSYTCRRYGILPATP
jgi:hypothetical protein